jgi:hypothetical protein
MPPAFRPRGHQALCSHSLFIYSFQVPIAYYRNRFPDPYTGASGDATFPNYIFLASYGYRFGGKGTADTAICPIAKHPDE